jgi:adenine-specific DNA-methyltransferase
MDYNKNTRAELVAYCKAQKIKGYSKKDKGEIIALLLGKTDSKLNTASGTGTSASGASVSGASGAGTGTSGPVKRLNYIGSKFQLLDWLTEHIREKTGWATFAGKRIADLFAGTGIVSHYFRTQSACVFSNDAELYSAVITHAFTLSSYTLQCASILRELQAELNANKHAQTVGFITEKYSPYNGNERMFFTVENAKRIDYLRQRLEDLQLADVDEYKFLLASLLLSADAVSNVPAVYGCYLKKFKAKALKNLLFVPIHTMQASREASSNTFNKDVLSAELLSELPASLDMVYLDPPYNERQYSKNYFPLNMIALTPTQQNEEKPLKGKTGIPESCFLSPFCRKGKPVEDAFEKLFKHLDTQWLFLSYNSESIVSKDKMLALMGKYGTVSVIEKPYKRFKSFEYNEDKEICEYLFCLQKK